MKTPGLSSEKSFLEIIPVKKLTWGLEKVLGKCCTNLFWANPRWIIETNGKASFEASIDQLKLVSKLWSVDGVHSGWGRVVRSRDPLTDLDWSLGWSKTNIVWGRPISGFDFHYIIPGSILYVSKVSSISVKEHLEHWNPAWGLLSRIP